MKKFLLTLIATILLLLVVFLFVSFIVANIRDIRVVDLWQSWGHFISKTWNQFINWAKK